MGLPSLSRETKFSGTNTDREIFIFPVQLTTCRTGNLIRLIHTLAICVTMHATDYSCEKKSMFYFQGRALAIDRYCRYWR